MKTKEKKHDPRNLKFAEAGILMVLILGLTIFVGVRMNADRPSEPEIQVSVQPVEAAPGSPDP